MINLSSVIPFLSIVAGLYHSFVRLAYGKMENSLGMELRHTQFHGIML
ncbi:MAG: hypothetical protein ACLU45_01830 [Dialister invisus]